MLFNKIGTFIKIGDIVKLKYFTVVKKKRKIFEVIGLCNYKNKKTVHIKFSCNFEPVNLCLDINNPFLLYVYRLYMGTPNNVKRSVHTYKNSFFRFTDFIFLNNLLRVINLTKADHLVLLYYKKFVKKTSYNLLQLARLDKKALFKIKKKYRI